MVEQIREENGGVLIKNIFFAIKRYLVLIIAIILIGTGCGIGYSFVKVPNYTATEEVIYLASDEQGKLNGTASGINIMRAYFNTVVDFCDEGVVVDRANYYYVQYVNRVSGAEPKLTVNEFVESLDVVDPYNETSSKEVNDYYIVKSNVSFSVNVESEDQDHYAFSIRYTDTDQEEAVKKARIYVEAFRRELKTTYGTSGGKYFDGIEIEIISLGSAGVTSDVSKTKFAVMGAVIGVVIACVLVYLITIADSSIKSKEELEEITGSKLITVIEYAGGKK